MSRLRDFQMTIQSRLLGRQTLTAQFGDLGALRRAQCRGIGTVQLGHGLLQRSDFVTVHGADGTRHLDTTALGRPKDVRARYAGLFC